MNSLLDIYWEDARDIKTAIARTADPRIDFHRVLSYLSGMLGWQLDGDTTSMVYRFMQEMLGPDGFHYDAPKRITGQEYKDTLVSSDV